jgi:hypothetical protein
MRTELQRLWMGPTEGQPFEGMNEYFLVCCPGNAPAVLDQAREVLSVLLGAREVLAGRGEGIAAAAAPVLTAWLESRVPPEAAERATRDPAEVVEVTLLEVGVRPWQWWDAKVLDPDRVLVHAGVFSFPHGGWDHLRSVFLWCGATEVHYADESGRPVEGLP